MRFLQVAAASMGLASWAVALHVVQAAELRQPRGTVPVNTAVVVHPSGTGGVGPSCLPGAAGRLSRTVRAAAQAVQAVLTTGH